MNLLAEFDFSILIYLLVGAFWLFSNLMQGKQTRSKAAEMKKLQEEQEKEERRTGKKIEVKPSAAPPKNDLQEFLKNLTNQMAPEAQQRAPTPPPPPIPKRKVVQPVIQFNGPPPTTTSSAPALANLPEKARASKSYDIGDLDMEASFKQISDIKEAVEVIHGDIDQALQQEALKNVRSMMVDLSSSSISVPSVHLQSIRAIRTKTSRPELQKKKTFKRALVASVILQAPKALRENPFTEFP
jgi:hypothetical protein